MAQGNITEADTPTIRLGATPSRVISDPPPSPIFTPDALPVATLPLYAGLGQAPNMLACIPSGIVYTQWCMCSKRSIKHRWCSAVAEWWTCLFCMLLLLRKFQRKPVKCRGQWILPEGSSLLSRSHMDNDHYASVLGCVIRARLERKKWNWRRSLTVDFGSCSLCSRCSLRSWVPPNNELLRFSLV